MSITTFDAHGGQTHYYRDSLDGTHKESGPNEPDQSITALLMSQKLTSERKVQYLVENRLTSVMLVRAFNACNIPGVATVLAGVTNDPVLAAWYATQEPVSEPVWNIPPPALPMPIMTPDERDFLAAVNKYVQHVMAR